jgi:glycosyltransferase involved in cell wall biosynthesis
VGSALSFSAKSDEHDGVKVVPLDRARVERFASQFAAFSLAPDFCRHLAAGWAAWEQTAGGAEFDRVECTDWGLSFVPWVLRDDAPPTLVRLHGSIGQISVHEPQRGFALAESLARLAESLLLVRADGLATYGAGNRDRWREALGRDVDWRLPPYRPAPAAPTAISQRGLVAARVQLWKGPFTLCRALTEMGDHAPELDWYGRSTLAPDGRSTAAVLAAEFPRVWGPLVHSHSTITPAELRSRQAASRFIVVPSTWDVFNYTAAEALASGTPLVCSDGAGAVSLVRHGENGFRFPAGDHQSLAASLREALDLSAATRARLGEAARETIATDLAPERIAALEHTALSSLVRTRSPVGDIAELATLFSPAGAPPRASSLSSSLARLPVAELARHCAARIVSRFSRR